MMLNLYVLQNQWIVITLLAGVALMLLFCLTYSAMWRPRGEEEKSQSIKVKGMTGFLESFLSVVPWVIILLVLASASFTVATLVAKSCRPPNW
jgi:heme/copper-type cytochrome/quinol oxidase subunit 2